MKRSKRIDKEHLLVKLKRMDEKVNKMKRALEESSEDSWVDESSSDQESEVKWCGEKRRQKAREFEKGRGKSETTGGKGILGKRPRRTGKTMNVGASGA